MGAANCCKRPDEIIVDEVRYTSTDNNKAAQADQESYPKDTEQVHRSNVNAEEDYGQGQAVSNQNLYEQEVGSSKIGAVYEVPINVSNPQQIYEEGYELNNVGLHQNQKIQSHNIETRNLNQYEQEEQDNQEGGADYAKLVNQMGNEANLKALKMGNLESNKVSGLGNYSSQISTNNNMNITQNSIANSGGVNLTSLSGVQQGGVDLRNISYGGQNGKNISQSAKQIGYNNNIIIQQQMESSNVLNNKLANTFQEGGKGKSNLQQSENDELNKYFKEATSRFASVNSQQTGNENIDNYARAKTTNPEQLQI